MKHLIMSDGSCLETFCYIKKQYIVTVYFIITQILKSQEAPYLGSHSSRLAGHACLLKNPRESEANILSCSKYNEVYSNGLAIKSPTFCYPLSLHSLKFTSKSTYQPLFLSTSFIPPIDQRHLPPPPKPETKAAPSKRKITCCSRFWPKSPMLQSEDTSAAASFQVTGDGWTRKKVGRFLKVFPKHLQNSSLQVIYCTLFSSLILFAQGGCLNICIGPQHDGGCRTVGPLTTGTS